MDNKEYMTNFKKELLNGFTKKGKTGLYTYLQQEFAYNSAKMSGNKLNGEQMSTIFCKLNNLYTKDNIAYLNDIFDVVGHYKMIHYMLETLDEPLSEKIIKELHNNLKCCDFVSGTSGEYKTEPNDIEDVQMTRPESVPWRIEKLLEWYSAIENSEYPMDDVEVHTLVLLHTHYEMIHPFQDGNGATGRAILLRECLRHNILPFIFTKDTKDEYIRVLHKAQVNKEYMDFIDYVAKMQKIFKEKVKQYIDFE